jgi:hypothetical protein
LGHYLILFLKIQNVILAPVYKNQNVTDTPEISKLNTFTNNKSKVKQSRYTSWRRLGGEEI